jgi:hypothetical protein
LTVWQVKNRTPFATAGYFVRDCNGSEYWVVALRARFRIRSDGLVEVASEQLPPRLVPEYRDSQFRELEAESDLAPFRPHTDILLNGVACAPGGRAVRQCEAGFRVGKHEKRARFFGERVLRNQGRWRSVVIEGPSEFLGVKLTWRAALGGADPFAKSEPARELHPGNPIGRGWTAKWRQLPIGAELMLPLIEDPTDPVVPGRPLPPPYGFGPIQPSWQPRLRAAGTYDAAWAAERAPLPPLDFTEAFYQAAPQDQIYGGELRGGEPVEIVGLHADGPYGFRLPQIIFESRTRIDTEEFHARPRLISVAINGTEKTLDCTWNVGIFCNGRDHMVDSTIVSLKQMSGVVS